jgi:hypothetical protein
MPCSPRPDQLRRPLIVSDPQALTVHAIVAALRRGLGRPPGLIPLLAAVLRTALYAAGRGEMYELLSAARWSLSQPDSGPVGLAVLAQS